MSTNKSVAKLASLGYEVRTGTEVTMILIEKSQKSENIAILTHEGQSMKILFPSVDFWSAILKDGAVFVSQGAEEADSDKRIKCFLGKKKYPVVEKFIDKTSSFPELLEILFELNAQKEALEKTQYEKRIAENAAAIDEISTRGDDGNCIVCGNVYTPGCCVVRQ